MSLFSYYSILTNSYQKGKKVTVQFITFVLIMSFNIYYKRNSYIKTFFENWRLLDIVET